MDVLVALTVRDATWGMLCVRQARALRAMTEAGGSVVAGAVEPCGGEFSVREAARMRQLAQDTLTRRSGTPRWLVVGSTRSGW